VLIIEIDVYIACTSHWIVVAFGRKENIQALKGMDIWIYDWSCAPISLASELGFMAKSNIFIYKGSIFYM